MKKNPFVDLDAVEGTDEEEGGEEVDYGEEEDEAEEGVEVDYDQVVSDNRQEYNSQWKTHLTGIKQKEDKLDELKYKDEMEDFVVRTEDEEEELKKERKRIISKKQQIKDQLKQKKKRKKTSDDTDEEDSGDEEMEHARMAKLHQKKLREDEERVLRQVLPSVRSREENEEMTQLKKKIAELEAREKITQLNRTSSTGSGYGSGSGSPSPVQQNGHGPSHAHSQWQRKILKASSHFLLEDGSRYIISRLGDTTELSNKKRFFETADLIDWQTISVDDYTICKNEETGKYEHFIINRTPYPYKITLKDALRLERMLGSEKNRHRKDEAIKHQNHHPNSTIGDGSLILPDCLYQHYKKEKASIDEKSKFKVTFNNLKKKAEIKLIVDELNDSYQSKINGILQGMFKQVIDQRKDDYLEARKDGIPNINEFKEWLLESLNFNLWSDCITNASEISTDIEIFQFIASKHEGKTYTFEEMLFYLVQFLLLFDEKCLFEFLTKCNDINILGARKERKLNGGSTSGPTIPKSR